MKSDFGINAWGIRMEREKLEFDVLFVAAGRQLGRSHPHQATGQKQGKEVEICLIEKAVSIGTHSLRSVLDPRALRELLRIQGEGLPDRGTDLRDGIFYLTSEGHSGCRNTPPYMHNEGCFIISLSSSAPGSEPWPRSSDVNIFPALPGRSPYDETVRRVWGVRTGDKGVNKDGKPNPTLSRIDLLAK